MKKKDPVTYAPSDELQSQNLPPKEWYRKYPKGPKANHHMVEGLFLRGLGLTKEEKNELRNKVRDKVEEERGDHDGTYLGGGSHKARSIRIHIRDLLRKQLDELFDWEEIDSHSPNWVNNALDMLITDVNKSITLARKRNDDKRYLISEARVHHRGSSEQKKHTTSSACLQQKQTADKRLWSAAHYMNNFDGLDDEEMEETVDIKLKTEAKTDPIPETFSGMVIDLTSSSQLSAEVDSQLAVQSAQNTSDALVDLTYISEASEEEEFSGTSDTHFRDVMEERFSSGINSTMSKKEGKQEFALEKVAAITNGKAVKSNDPNSNVAGEEKIVAAGDNLLFLSRQIPSTVEVITIVTYTHITTTTYKAGKSESSTVTHEKTTVLPPKIYS